LKILIKMTDYKVSLKQLKKAKIPAKAGKEAWFLSFTEGGIIRVKVKKIEKGKAILTSCDWIEN